MRKAKSRNFILIICGFLLLLLVGFTFAKFLINVIVKVDDQVYEEELLANVVSTSSKVEINGRGNFVDSTPVIEKLSISNFHVMLSEYGDKVNYLVKYCNMNNEDLVYDGLVEGNVSCSDENGNEISCDTIHILGYVISGNKELEVGNRIAANSCIQVVVDVEYEGIIAKDVYTLIENYTLKLKRK